jgi:predicted nucleotidyltransferase
MGQSVEGEAMIQLEQHRHAILDAAARHGARNVRVFGSVARGDDRTDSDIDLLVEMADDRSLLDLVALEQELQSLLNRPVDVLTTQSLAPAIRERVAADARAVKDERVYLGHIREAIADIRTCAAVGGAVDAATQ